MQISRLYDVNDLSVRKDAICLGDEIVKVYISADIEGIAGTYHWDETEKRCREYEEFRDQMTAEVAAACRGASAGGARELWVKDAHDTGRNIIHSELPESAVLLRGWSGHPFQMIEGLDDTFSALIMIGYHSGSDSARSPLSHTGSRKISSIKINGASASEMMVYGYAAATVGVPLVFLSGDSGICEESEKINPGMTTLAVKEGRGNSVATMHPKKAVEEIESGVKNALQGNRGKLLLSLPEKFVVELTYREHVQAYRASFFPGVRALSSNSISFETNDYFEVLKMLLYLN